MLYGKMLIQDNKIEEGLAHLKEAVKTKPSSSNAHHYLSIGLEVKGDLRLALESAKIAKGLAPSSKTYINVYDSLKAKLRKSSIGQEK